MCDVLKGYELPRGVEVRAQTWAVIHEGQKLGTVYRTSNPGTLPEISFQVEGIGTFNEATLDGAFNQVVLRGQQAAQARLLRDQAQQLITQASSKT